MNEALPWIFAVAACGALGTALVALWASFRAAFGGAVPIELSSEVDHDARVRLLEEKESLLKNLSDLRFDHDAGKISDADFERLDGKLRERTKTVLRHLDADVEPFRAEAERLIAARLGGTTRDPFREVAAEQRSSKGKGSQSEEVTTKKEKKDVRDAMLAALDLEPSARDAKPVDGGSSGETKKKDVDAIPAAQGAEPEPKETSSAASSDASASNEPSNDAASETKSCPSCATENDGDAVFCKKCGHRFESSPSADASTASAEEER